MTRWQPAFFPHAVFSKVPMIGPSQPGRVGRRPLDVPARQRLRPRATEMPAAVDPLRMPIGANHRR
jgi:hypothetical protein